MNSDIGDKFTIHPISGWVLTAGSLDRETQATYNLVVTVTDGDVKTNSATVTVTLEDVNDKAPNFDSSSYNAVIPSTSQSGMDNFRVTHYAPSGKAGIMDFIQKYAVP